MINHKLRSYFFKMVLVIVAIVTLYCYIKDDVDYRNKHVMGVELIDKETEQQLIKGKKKKDLTRLLLSYNNEKIPFDSETDTIYISQSMKNEKWVGTLTPSKDKYEIYILEDRMFSDKLHAIRKAHHFSYIVIDGDNYYKGKIVFTGLPTVLIKGAANDKLADITVSYPDAEEEKNKLIHTKCTFHQRGSASVGYEKFNYKVELCDENGEKEKHSILGMREDDDWLLNGLYTDETKVREKLAYDLWHKMNETADFPVATSNMEYAEVFLNNEYIGLYGIMEPIDGKQMGMKEGDLLYKIRRWSLPESGNFDLCGNTLEMNDFDGGNLASLKYPKSTDQEFSWEPYREYINSFMSENSANSEITVAMNLENVVDYYWFCQLTYANDNLWKNVYLAAYKADNGNYTFYKTVWDLNYTWGEVWDSPEENLWTKFIWPDGNLLQINDYDKLLREDEVEVRTAEQKRWRQWKESGISADMLSKEAKEWYEHLENSGALRREKRKNPQSESAADIEDLQKWIKVRFDEIDNYFTSRQLEEEGTNNWSTE